jgi:hypothetical protein
MEGFVSNIRNEIKFYIPQCQIFISVIRSVLSVCPSVRVGAVGENVEGIYIYIYMS